MITGANPGGIASRVGDDRSLQALRTVSCTCVLQADSFRESQFTIVFSHCTVLCARPSVQRHRNPALILTVRVPKVGMF